MTPKSAQSTTHCSHSAIVPKAFCLRHPSLPLNSSTSLSTPNTHCIPLTTVILEHILLLCTNTSLFFPHRWALTQHFPSHSWLQDTSAIYLPCPCRAPAPFLQPLQQSMLLTTPNLNSFCALSTPPQSPNNPLSDHHGPVFQHGPVHVAKTQIIPSASICVGKDPQSQHDAFIPRVFVLTEQEVATMLIPSLKEINGKWNSATLNFCAVHWAAAHWKGTSAKKQQKTQPWTPPFLSKYSVCKSNPTEDITTMLMKPWELKK